jgi:predicted TIM-barrel fold metal-dependent hydrolase
MEAAMNDLEIVDPHHHLWELGHHRYPWLTPQSSEDQPLATSPAGDLSILRHDYLPDDYRRDAQGHNVVQTVHVEAEWDRDDQVGETRWLEGIARRYGLPHAVVAHAWFEGDDAADVLAAQAAFPSVRGIRSKPVTAPTPAEPVARGPGSMSSEAWRRGFARLESHELSYDLRVPYWHLEEAADLARDFPAIQFILNHAGLPWHRDAEPLAAWRAGMEALAAHPNAAVKISFLLSDVKPWTSEANRGVVRDTIAIFGAQRCMFASNYPVDRLLAPFATLYDAYKDFVADMAPTDQVGLFSANALRFYRLDAAP